MKVFWSWQSDTPGKTGRHFVRDCLTSAIAALKQPDDVEEPTKRATREELHLDHDRKGVSGSPDLAPTILEKIDDAAVFVGDVTIVAEIAVQGGDGKERKKGLINSNVGIEYGYALRGLTDERILMVQNTHYGERDLLPFDLQHKAGPIQYRLAPDASTTDIKKAAGGLIGQFVVALEPFIAMGSRNGEQARFERTPHGQNQALFADRGEVIARYGTDLKRFLGHGEDDDAQEYTFDEETVFYLRLIPTKPLHAPIKRTDLDQLMQQRRAYLPTRNAGAPLTDRNRFGAIGYEPHGTSPTPMAFTQLFQNGEIWGASKEVFVRVPLGKIIQMPNVPGLAKQTLDSWVALAVQQGVEFPIEIECGLIGIEGFVLPTNRQGGVTQKIHQPQCVINRVINAPDGVAQVVAEFNSELWDMAGYAPR
jgi:hypothetical protein